MRRLGRFENGNGTFAPTTLYEWILTHWASHGFIVAAANTTGAGTGKEMLACLDWVEQQNSVPGPYEGKVAVGRAGASGHSQGGGGAIMAGRDPRIAATVPIMAYTIGLGHDLTSEGMQHGPMLLLSGSADTTAVPIINQGIAFQLTNVPAVWATLNGATHQQASGGGIPGFLAPSTAWFRLHLMCDEKARPIFYGACTLCKDPNWSVQRKGIN